MPDKKLANDILVSLGGTQNIRDLSHCATRVLVTPQNVAKVMQDALNQLDGVHAALIRSDRVEIILGTGIADKVYRQIAALMRTSTGDAMKDKVGKKEKKGENKLKDKLFGTVQKFGKAIMLPIAVLPAAGLLLGIGGALSNPNTLKVYPFLDQAWLQAIFVIMSSAGDIIFANLPLIFAVGIAIGLARSDKGTAGLAAVIGYLVMNVSLNAMLTITGKLATDDLSSAGQAMVLGIQTLQTGVFGGVVVGLLTYALHDKFGKVQLPQFLAFFGGSRFIPIITTISSVVLGIAMFVIWPPIQMGIAKTGWIVEQTSYVGSFFFGFIVKSLGPLGLHHIFYLPFWQTGIGGVMEVNGQVVQGTQNIFFAQLADPNIEQFYSGVSRFMSGKYLPIMFGLQGAVLAMYHTAKPENRKKVFGLLFSAALTAFLTGITEPIEFLFLFVAPVLFIIHAAFWGLAYLISHIFNITIGMTFSGGLIDFTLFGILQGNDKTNWVLVLVFGLFFFALYYVIFRFLIVKFNFKTPGREDNEESGSGRAVSSSERAVDVLAALGGKENIKELDCCATRLRVTVDNANEVSEQALKDTGAKGVIVRGSGVQVVYGPHVSIIKAEVEELLES